MARGAVSWFIGCVSSVKLRVSALLVIFAPSLACGGGADTIDRGEGESAVGTEGEPAPGAGGIGSGPVGAEPSTGADPEGTGGCELRQIERLLDDNCGVCHSMPRFFVPPDCYGSCTPQPIFVSDLIAIDKITPGDAAASRVMIRLRDGSMPPPQSGLPPLPEAEQAWLASFIDRLDPDEEPSCEAGNEPSP